MADWRVEGTLWKDAPPAGALKTGQTTVYHVGDDGSFQKGKAKSYTVLTAGPHAGTVNVDAPHYAAATIAFAATTPGTITDSANLLATVKTGDIIIIRGSASNDGTYNVSTGNVAGTIRTTEATLLEAAGAYVSICKRVSPSNACVLDNNTGLMWRRATTTGELVGPTSAGTLVWYDATKVYTLHPAGADLQMIASPATLRIVGGAGESARYHVGDVIDCSGFANAVNNLPGYVVTAVTVNGADLDLSLQTHGGTLIAEAAAGARAIGLVVQSIFSYIAAMNVAALGGYSDWRVPYPFELHGLANIEVATAVPNATAFPSWPSDNVWTTGTTVSDTATGFRVAFSIGSCQGQTKTVAYYGAFVRGG